MSPDIFAIKNLLKEDKIWNAAKHHMENYHNSQVSFSRNRVGINLERKNPAI